MSQEQVPLTPIELVEGFTDPTLADRDEACRFVEAIQPRDWNLFHTHAAAWVGEAVKREVLDEEQRRRRLQRRV